MSHYKPYPAYKDSGVGWLGEVPEHWELRPLKQMARLDGGAGFPDDEQGVQDGHIPFFKVADLANGMITAENYITEETAARLRAKIFSVGTIAFAKVGAALLLNRRVLMPISGCADNNMMVVCPREVDGKWLLLVLSCFDMSWLVNPGAVPSVNQEQVGNIKIPIPSWIEQKNIVARVDRETARIDALISKKTRFIELLREKRQALITQAVTKGLDTNVKMKDSGVEWLGEVPEGWEVKPLKHLANHIGSGKTPSGGAEAYQDSGVIFLRSQNVYEEGLRLDDVAFISREIDEEMKNSRVSKNDVLLNITGASIGRSCHVSQDIGPANVNQHVCIIRTKFEALGKWVARLMASHVAQSQIDYYQNGAGREGLNFEQIGNMVFAFPPPSQVHDIVEELSKLTSSANLLIKKTERSIELLKERRAALITAAVTGQIDLREAA